jgi:RNA polymerase sigma factor (sigma-70 family)
VFGSPHYGGTLQPETIAWQAWPGARGLGAFMRNGKVVADLLHKDDEADLISAAKQGDTAAFGELIKRHSDTAFRVALLITRSAADAEDAVQDALWNCFRALHRFRAGAAFRPWLLQIVSNEAKSRSRSEIRRLGRQSQWLETTPSVESDEAFENAMRRELRATLLRGIHGLRDEERLVIELRYYLDLTTAETAQVLDCAEGTVKSRLSRALMNLRARIGIELG